MGYQKLPVQQKDNIGQGYSAKKTVESDKAHERILESPLSYSMTAGASSPSIPHTPQDILSLQRTIGNQAVGRFIQAKLKIGQPGDKYEQEADRVADEVMGMPESEAQRQAEEEEEPFQAKPLAEQITPLVQRQVEEEEEETIQTKPISSEITSVIQRQGDFEEEEEESIQSKSVSGNINEGSDLVRLPSSSRDDGRSLPENTRHFMNSLFGADFSGVRVHTDNNAMQMSNSLNARAFALGNDVYFNEGEYNPGSDSGKRLLAHELTHVVQQDGDKVQRKNTKDKNGACKEWLKNFWEDLCTDKAKSLLDRTKWFVLLTSSSLHMDHVITRMEKETGVTRSECKEAYFLFISSIGNVLLKELTSDPEGAGIWEKTLGKYYSRYIEGNPKLEEFKKNLEKALISKLKHKRVRKLGGKFEEKISREIGELNGKYAIAVIQGAMLWEKEMPIVPPDHWPKVLRHAGDIGYTIGSLLFAGGPVGGVVGFTFICAAFISKVEADLLEMEREREINRQKKFAQIVLENTFDGANKIRERINDNQTFLAQLLTFEALEEDIDFEDDRELNDFLWNRLFKEEFTHTNVKEKMTSELNEYLRT